jgi:hypothetical protein
MGRGVKLQTGRNEIISTTRRITAIRFESYAPGCIRWCAVFLSLQRDLSVPGKEARTMKKSQKLFRYLWRINAILILIAASAVTFGVTAIVVGEFWGRTARNREAKAGIPVAAADSNIHLLLGRASVVIGTDVMRADLTLSRGGAGFSSGGGYVETRNVLFIEPGQKEARWLLPDNDHVISESSDITDRIDANTKRMIATAVLVKPATGSPELPQEGFSCSTLLERKLWRWRATHGMFILHPCPVAN